MDINKLPHNTGMVTLTVIGGLGALGLVWLLASGVVYNLNCGKCHTHVQQVLAVPAVVQFASAPTAKIAQPSQVAYEMVPVSSSAPTPVIVQNNPRCFLGCIATSHVNLASASASSSSASSDGYKPDPRYAKELGDEAPLAPS